MRKTRRPASETRERLLVAGLEALETEGLEPSVEHLTLERAIRAAGVPRSSGYHAWSGDTDGPSPQEAYQRVLIRRAIDQSVGKRSMDALNAAFAEALNGADRLSGTALKRELIRRAGEANYQVSVVNRGLAISAALLTASTTTDSSLAREVRAWTRDAELRWRTNLIQNAFKPLAEVVGMVPRPEFDHPLVWDRLTAAVNALGSSLISRHDLLEPEVSLAIERVGPDGEPEYWTLFAVGIEALVDQFLWFPPE